MKPLFFSFIILFTVGLLLVSCSNHKVQVLSNEEGRITNKNIAEVIKDSKTVWGNSEGNSLSSVLHFNLDSPEKISIEITPECWLELPIRLTNNVATVYWYPIIDSKYDFPIVKTIEKAEQDFTDQPFMTLVLVNDSTLKACYPNPELREKLNKTDRNRLLFPEKYVALKLD